MKVQPGKLNKLLFLVCVIMLSCSAMASAMAPQGSAFFPLQLPAQSSRDPGSEDCALGSLTADGLRYAAESDFAIVCGGELGEHVPQGEVTCADAQAAFAGELPLMWVRVSGEELRILLETLVSHVTVDMDTETIDRETSAFAGFPNLSGLTMVYDPTAPVGERIVSLTREDGTPLDMGDEAAGYTLAGSSALFDGSYGAPVFLAQSTGETCGDGFYRYLLDEGAGMKELKWQRVTSIGTVDNGLVSDIPPVVLAVCVLLAALCMVWVNRRRKT